jgi:hypothetical protein
VEEQLGREGEHVKIGRADQRAIGDALLAPERGVKRDRIAGKGEEIFEREVDLIDVARGDVVLDACEGAGIVLARPGQPQVGERRASASAVGVQPGARLFIIQAARRAEEPDPK